MTTPETSSDTLLSVIAVAERLSCSRTHVYRLIAAGELPIIDIATPGSIYAKTRIRESDLAAYLDRAASH